jgi:hypothetical protein
MAQAPYEIKFTADKNGRPLAHRWCWRMRRWFRMTIDAARIAVSTGPAFEAGDAP